MQVPTPTDRRRTVGLRLALLALFATGCGRVGFDDQVADADTDVLPPGSPAVVQTGIIDWQSGDSMRSASITPVNPAKSLLVFSVSVESTSPGALKIAGELQATDTVAFFRAATGAPARVFWQVIRWDGWSVERGASAIPGADVEAFSTLQRAVEPSQSLVLATTAGDGSLFNDDECVRAELISPTQVRFAISNTGTPTDIRWQVVEMPTAAVQRGLVSLPMGTTASDVPITAIDPSRSWLVQSYSSSGLDTGVVAASMLVHGRILDGRSLRFERSDGEGDHVVAWQVAEIPAAVVQHGTLTLSLGQPTRQASLVEVEPTSAFTFGGAWGGTSGSTDYAIDANPGTAWATARLVGRTTIELDRAQTTGTATIPWSVLELR